MWRARRIRSRVRARKRRTRYTLDAARYATKAPSEAYTTSTHDRSATAAAALAERHPEHGSPMTIVAGTRSWWPRVPRRRALVLALLAAALAPVGIAAAQRFRFMEEPNVPYDGRFTFARLRYQIVY